MESLVIFLQTFKTDFKGTPVLEVSVVADGPQKAITQAKHGKMKDGSKIVHQTQKLQ